MVNRYRSTRFLSTNHYYSLGRSIFIMYSPLLLDFFFFFFLFWGGVIWPCCQLKLKLKLVSWLSNSARKHITILPHKHEDFEGWKPKQPKQRNKKGGSMMANLVHKKAAQKMMGSNPTQKTKKKCKHIALRNTLPVSYQTFEK